jgi:hypothetical protein
MSRGAPKVHDACREIPVTLIDRWRGVVYAMACSQQLYMPFTVRLPPPSFLLYTFLHATTVACGNIRVVYLSLLPPCLYGRTRIFSLRRSACEIWGAPALGIGISDSKGPANSEAASRNIEEKPSWNQMA